MPNPLASIRRGSPNATASRASCTVDSPTRISAGAAACWSRAPRFTSAPITMLRSNAVPTATWPVRTPIRTWMGVPRPSSCASSAARERISMAVRIARTASSSRARGIPNTTSTASPMKVSATPPSHAASSATIPWNAASTSRNRSGSNEAASCVEFAMSTKTIETIRRSLATGTATGAPQFGQKFAPGGSGSPQRGQRSALTDVLDDLHRVAVGVAKHREPRVPLDLADVLVEDRATLGRASSAPRPGRGRGAPRSRSRADRRGPSRAGRCGSCRRRARPIRRPSAAPAAIRPRPCRRRRRVRGRGSSSRRGRRSRARCYLAVRARPRERPSGSVWPCRRGPRPRA